MDEVKEEIVAQEENLSKKELRKRKKAEKKAKKSAENAKKPVIRFRAKKNGKKVSRLMNFLRVIAFPIHWCVYPFKMYGPHKVGKGAYIYMGNHYCLWDIFYPAHTTWEGIHFLAKQSVMDAPIMGSVARKIGVIGAMRDGSDVRTVMEAIKALKHGEKISLFPEGTRNKTDGKDFLPFHGGAAIFAIKTKTPIVPFVVYNKPKVFRMTHVVFGEPFELSEYYGRKLTQAEYDEAENKLRNRLYELRDSHTEYLQNKKNKKKKQSEGNA